MNWFSKLPGFQRTSAGREWTLWRRLPAILAWGTALPALVALGYALAAPAEPTAAQQRELLLVHYRLIGVLLLHWTLVLTLAIGCVIVMLMKGPAYTADSYPPEGRDRPG